MARDRASIYTNLWADEDWRALPVTAQHLYLLLLSHPLLTQAGVTDWRPGRLAAMSANRSVEEVREAAATLETARFILTDEDSEEVLIRSFTRHDGVLKHPYLAIAMTTAYAGIASKKLRSVITFELHRLQTEYPGWVAWTQEKMQTILKAPGTNITEYLPAPDDAIGNATGNGIQNATHNGIGNGIETALPMPLGMASPSISISITSPSSKDDGVTSPKVTRVAADFSPTPELLAWAATNTPDVDVHLATQKFLNHWQAAAGRPAYKVDWQAAWKAWLIGDQQRAPANKLSGSELRARKVVARLTEYQTTEQRQHEIGN